MVINQYQVVIVSLDPTVGSEIKKTRPCLVLSPIEMNKSLKTIVVAPMTTRIKSYPTRLNLISENGKVGQAAIDQIRTVDKKRILKIVGKISEKEIEDCKKIIKEAFVD